MSGFDDNNWTPVANGSEQVSVRNGALWGKEGRGNHTWYFVAPSKFLGDKSVAYGGALIWDYTQDSDTDQFKGNDVILMSNGMMLATRTGRFPKANMFRTTGVVLNDKSGWRIRASGAWRSLQPGEFAKVLKNLTALWIRGEYKVGNDASAIRNVRLVTGTCQDKGDVLNGQISCPPTIVLPETGVFPDLMVDSSEVTSVMFVTAMQPHLPLETLAIGQRFRVEVHYSAPLEAPGAVTVRDEELRAEISVLPEPTDDPLVYRSAPILLVHASGLAGLQ